MYQFRPGDRLSFLYENYRGEISERDVIFKSIEFGSNQYYPEEQWFIRCYDNHKNADRSFALAKINPNGIVKL